MTPVTPVPPVRCGWGARAFAGRVDREQDRGSVDHQYSRNARLVYITGASRSLLAQFPSELQVNATGTHGGVGTPLNTERR